MSIHNGTEAGIKTYQLQGFIPYVIILTVRDVHELKVSNYLKGGYL